MARLLDLQVRLCRTQVSGRSLSGRDPNLSALDLRAATQQDFS